MSIRLVYTLMGDNHMRDNYTNPDNNSNINNN